MYACRKQTPMQSTPRSRNHRATARAPASSKPVSGVPEASMRSSTSPTRCSGTIRSGLTQKYELP